MTNSDASATTPPSDRYSWDGLRAIRPEYLRENDQKEFRRLARKGLLEEHLDQKARAAQAFASDLMATGTMDSQAWSWAVRVELLESEMD